MLMAGPPVTGFNNQDTQLLGNPQQQNNPQMMQMLMQLAGKGGFGGHGMAGPSMGPIHQGPLGTPAPPPQMGGRI